MAQSVKHVTLAQVMGTQSMSWSPELSSVLTAQSLEPALDSVSASLSVPPLLSLSHSLLSSANNLKKCIFKIRLIMLFKFISSLLFKISAWSINY